MTNNSPLTKFRRHPWLLVIVAVWLFLFWPILVGSECLAFRDSAHLYFPLFEWIDVQWERGELPFWNPQDDFGRPVVADGSSSVFYPGKLIFWLRFLDYPTRFGIFVSIHVLFAAFAAYWAGLVFRCRPRGAAVAAISFAFGGPVLFQTSNVIFLVSAAWLPVAMGFLWKLISRGHFRDALGGGMASAMMILGGDAQMAYHVFLLAGAVLVCRLVGRCVRWRRRPGESKSLGPHAGLSLARTAVLVALLVTMACGLAAVQILPTWQWGKNSWRKSRVHPRSLIEAVAPQPEESDRDFTQGLLGEPVAGTHHEQLYQFSLPPWSVAELVWPNVSGKNFPNNERWTSGLMAADRIWMPSLYLGVVVLLLALSRVGLRKREPCERLLSWMALAFTIASFGWYGLGWIAAELESAFPSIFPSLSMGKPVGGLYWLLVSVLPEYVSFRYPAKLFVVAALAISLLAGRGLDTLWRSSRRRWIVVILVTSLGSSILALVPWNTWLTGWADRVPVSELGVFDPGRAASGLTFSFAQTAIVTALFGIALAVWRRAPSRPLAACIGVLVLCDLVVANRWLLPTVEAGILHPKLQNSNRVIPFDSRAVPPPRRLFERAGERAIRFDQPADAENPFASALRFQRENQFAKFHLSSGVSIVGSFSSIEPANFRAIDHVIRDNDFVDKLWVLDVVDFRENRRTGPPRGNPQRGWVLEDLHKGDTVDELNQVINQVSRRMSTGPVDFETRANLVEYGPNRATIRVRSAREGESLFFSDYWDPNWQATIRDLDEEAKATRVDVEEFATFRAIDLPGPGVYEITMTYRPIPIYVGAVISLLSALILLGVFVRQVALRES